jgi:hypothetical protein
MYRPTPNFKTAILVLAVIIAGLYISAVSADTIMRAAMFHTFRVAPTPAPRQDWRPDIRHCVDDDPSTDPWACIRHVEED